jgi:hypothetical protein
MATKVKSRSKNKSKNRSRSKGAAKKKNVTRSKAKTTAQARSRTAGSDSVQRIIDRQLPGYVALGSSPKPVVPKVSTSVGKTASLDRMKAKLAPASRSSRSVKSESPVGHGRIVRVRSAKKNVDPADEIGDKAVYIGPSGDVEFRQG